MIGRKKTILVVTGTRAEYGLLHSTIEELQKSKKFSVRLLVTGMHTLKRYGRTIREIEKDAIPINAVVPVGDSDDMLTALSKEIIGIKKYCEKHTPDMLLVLGDRDEPFAAAIVAGHMKIPVAHIHGGDVTGPIVDEYIRHAITKFSHLHFTVSEASHKRVLQLGEAPWRVFTVGAPGLDGIIKKKLFSKSRLARQLGLQEKSPWALVVQHPVALDSLPVKEQIGRTLKALRSFQGEKIIVYPNSDTKSTEIIAAIETFRGKPSYHIFKNIARETYLSLLQSADFLMGNSSSGIIEGGFFHLPVIDIGPRQKNRECGENVLRVPCDSAAIRRALQKVLTSQFKKICRTARHPYGNGGAAKKIVHILETLVNDPRLFSKESIYAARH